MTPLWQGNHEAQEQNEADEAADQPLLDVTELRIDMLLLDGRPERARPADGLLPGGAHGDAASEEGITDGAGGAAELGGDGTK